MDSKIITPLLFSVFIAWAVYRRARRSIGRQPLAPKRMILRVVVLALVGALTLIASLGHLNLAAALLGGAALGAALGYAGLRHTKFGVTPEGRFYTPHTYVGLFVMALFLGRFAYRLILIYPVMHAAAKASDDPFAAYQKSPLTLAILGMLIGYYVFYYAGLLVKNRALSGGDPGTVTETV